MLFSSITFLYVFLPGVVILYFLAPGWCKNYVLLAGSILFYAWGEPGYLLLLLAEIAAGCVFGRLIEKAEKKVTGKLFLGASLFVDFALLAYFKYADFFIQNFSQLTGQWGKPVSVALPIGISFYTFQMASYSIDVYRGETEAQKNPFVLACYVTMFPQLIAGPIVRYTDIKQQLQHRTHSYEKAAAGIRRFVIGLSKKVLIADTLGQLCSTFRESSDLSVAYYWLSAVAFTLQIYYDFSGYSDMAIGMGNIFGFDFLENFKYPYAAKSITQFWRRWHISLGSWFRDYVYIPLGGNRCSFWKWVRNVCLVWFLTGFWHGASWNFIVWGMFFSVFFILEKLFLGELLKKAKGWNHIYVMFLVVVSFVIFHAADLTQAGNNLRCMFGGGKLPLISREFLYYGRSYGVIFFTACMGAVSLPKRLMMRIRKTHIGDEICKIAEPVWILGLLMLVTAYLVDGSFLPFLYFRF